MLFDFLTIRLFWIKELLDFLAKNDSWGKTSVNGVSSVFRIIKYEAWLTENHQLQFSANTQNLAHCNWHVISKSNHVVHHTPTYNMRCKDSVYYTSRGVLYHVITFRDHVSSTTCCARTCVLAENCNRWYLRKSSFILDYVHNRWYSVNWGLNSTQKRIINNPWPSMVSYFTRH